MKSIKLPSWIDKALGFAAVPAPPHVFAVDARELRYGCFPASGKGHAFETLRGVELPPDSFGAVLGAPLQDPQVLTTAIAELVQSLPGTVREASLVLPDAWMRLTFTEITDLPRKSKDLDEVLRWKLKRLVPYRIEDLRVSATEVTPFPNQEEPRRLLLGFAVESLVAHLEEAFAAAGVEIGRVTNQTLATLASLSSHIGSEPLAALATVSDDALCLTYFRGGEPLLYRYKAFGEGMLEHEQASSVRRDLRLTASFVRENFADTPLRHLFMAVPESSQQHWYRWLYDELDAPPEALGLQHFALERPKPALTWQETAAMLGAAAQEVSW